MRRRAWPWTWIGVLASIGIVVVTTVAAVDHVRKTHVPNRSSLSAWYCIHRGLRCEDAKKLEPAEAAWNRREKAYKAGDVVLLFVAVGAVIAVRCRR